LYIWNPEENQNAMKKILLFLAGCFILSTGLAQSTGITVITPNGGETWTINCPQIIQWTTVAPMSVKIELYKAGVFYMTICSQVPANMLSYTWIPPYSVVAANTYKVKVTSLTNSIHHDFSNGHFTIQPGSITVVSPNGGEVWQIGSTHNILWTDNLCENVRIELWKGGGFNSLIVASTPSNGSYSWTILPNSSSTIIPGNDYRVRILSAEPNTSSNLPSDFSDAHFTICTGPYIIVTSPNGGEVWARGTTRCITWQDNIPQDVRVELWKGNVFQSLIAASTPSTGSCFWAIPATQPIGHDYKVKILALSSSGNLTLYDFSDNCFSIVCMAPPVASLTDSDVTIYPNPCQNTLNVKFQRPAPSPVTVRIFSVTGQMVLEQNQVTGVTCEIDTSPLKNGSYILVVQAENTVLARKSFTILH
jgi:hypothetical protein